MVELQTQESEQLDKSEVLAILIEAAEEASKVFEQVAESAERLGAALNAQEILERKQNA